MAEQREPSPRIEDDDAGVDEVGQSSTFSRINVVYEMEVADENRSYRGCRLVYCRWKLRRML